MLQKKIMLTLDVEEYFQKEIILNFKILHPLDSTRSISQQLSFECLINKSTDEIQLENEIKNSLRLDSLEGSGKKIIPYFVRDVKGSKSIVIRPSKLIISD